MIVAVALVYLLLATLLQSWLDPFIIMVAIPGDDRTSFMGLEKPLIELKNPGIISIPLGFLAVLFGSLLFRDKRAEGMWNEVYARQNTGLLVSKATGH